MTAGAVGDDAAMRAAALAGLRFMQGDGDRVPVVRAASMILTSMNSKGEERVLERRAYQVSRHRHFMITICLKHGYL